jgi:hypothetical protein
MSRLTQLLCVVIFVTFCTGFTYAASRPKVRTVHAGQLEPFCGRERSGSPQAKS